MARVNTAPFMWIAWALAFFGWVLMLAALSALQNGCAGRGPNALLAAGAAGFLGAVECGSFYAYSWFILWLLFTVAVVLAPLLLAADGVASFRAALLGLLAVTTMLVGDAANSFQAFSHVGLSGETAARARTFTAGSIIASVGLYALILLAGVVDERSEGVVDTGEPRGETRGGRLGGKARAGEPWEEEAA
jgi:hypothetical protein